MRERKEDGTNEEQSREQKEEVRDSLGRGCQRLKKPRQGRCGRERNSHILVADCTAEMAKQ